MAKTTRYVGPDVHAESISVALAAQLLSEHSVLFFQILKHSTLLSLQPTRDHREDAMQGTDLQEALARSAVIVGDGRHGRTAEVCGITERS